MRWRAIALAGMFLAGLVWKWPEPSQEHGAAAPPNQPPAPRIRNRVEPIPHQKSNGTAPEQAEPHPMNEARGRIAAQHRMFAEIEQALARQELGQARLLLREHERAFSDREAWLDQRQGFELIVDCTERLSAPVRERAQRFVDERRGSTLRRRVRRACLADDRTRKAALRRLL